MDSSQVIIIKDKWNEPVGDVRPELKIYRVFAIFNGIYDENLFTYGKISFHGLKGYKRDLENLMNFLKDTKFD